MSELRELIDILKKKMESLKQTKQSSTTDIDAPEKAKPYSSTI